MSKGRNQVACSDGASMDIIGAYSGEASDAYSGEASDHEEAAPDTVAAPSVAVNAAPEVMCSAYHVPTSSV